MNAVTTADLRNHFRRVSAWLENGESVEIMKRGKPYATLVPISKTKASAHRKVDFRAQCHAFSFMEKFRGEVVVSSLVLWEFRQSA